LVGGRDVIPEHFRANLLKTITASGSYGDVARAMIGFFVFLQAWVWHPDGGPQLAKTAKDVW
jgi:hypothetical protein